MKPRIYTVILIKNKKMENRIEVHDYVVNGFCGFVSTLDLKFERVMVITFISIRISCYL